MSQPERNNMRFEFLVKTNKGETKKTITANDEHSARRALLQEFLARGIQVKAMISAENTA